MPVAEQGATEAQVLMFRYRARLAQTPLFYNKFSTTSVLMAALGD